MVGRDTQSKGRTVTGFNEFLGNARDQMTVERVYGAPYEANGVVFIPAASIKGGLGGGEGEGNETTPSGRGGGFGVAARPIGAYRISGDEVKWVPAVDVTRVVLTGQAIAIVALLVFRSIARMRA